MILTEKNYKEKISSFSRQDWQQLFDLINEIENTSEFEILEEEEKEENGVIKLPNYLEVPVVSRFREIVYEIPIIIDFDWGSWDEGRKMARTENFDIDTIDIPTKCKLITAIVRNDRFCDGALASAFDSGLLLKILKSIRKQID